MEKQKEGRKGGEGRGLAWEEARLVARTPCALRLEQPTSRFRPKGRARRASQSGARSLPDAKRSSENCQVSIHCWT